MIRIQSPQNALSFAQLRRANALRLPLFRNRHGQLAHSAADGSDWAPAQWLQAMVGEVGEWAEVRLAYEDGRITQDEYERASPKELADIAIYHDILARRSNDRLSAYLGDDGRARQGYPFDSSAAQRLLRVMAALGAYANTRKKFDRGDLDFAAYRSAARESLAAFMHHAVQLHEVDAMDEQRQHPGDQVQEPHPVGVDLERAITQKFNEVSDRVGAEVKL